MGRTESSIDKEERSRERSPEKPPELGFKPMTPCCEATGPATVLYLSQGTVVTNLYWIREEKFTKTSFLGGAQLHQL